MRHPPQGKDPRSRSGRGVVMDSQVVGDLRAMTWHIASLFSH